MYTLRLSCFWSLTNYQRVQGDWSPRACSLGRSGFVIMTVSGFGRHLTAASQFHSYCCSKADWVSVLSGERKTITSLWFITTLKAAWWTPKQLINPLLLFPNWETMSSNLISNPCLFFSDSEWIISEYHSRISFSKFKVKLILHFCQFLNHTRIEVV